MKKINNILTSISIWIIIKLLQFIKYLSKKEIDQVNFDNSNMVLIPRNSNNKYIIHKNNLDDILLKCKN